VCVCVCVCACAYIDMFSLPVSGFRRYGLAKIGVAKIRRLPSLLGLGFRAQSLGFKVQGL